MVKISTTRGQHKQNDQPVCLLKVLLVNPVTSYRKKYKPEVLLMVNVWFSNANILAERETSRAASVLLTSWSIFLNKKITLRQEATCQVGRQQDQRFAG